MTKLWSLIRAADRTVGSPLATTVRHLRERRLAKAFPMPDGVMDDIERVTAQIEKHWCPRSK